MVSTTTSTPLTPFERDLKVYFPDLFKFWSIAKYDKHHNKLIDAVNKMVDSNGYGTIRVIYQNGKINYVFLEENLTASLTNQPK